MKQINSVIASILVSGLLVVGMVGIGANALTNTSSVPTNTSTAGALINSSNTRTGRRFESRSARGTNGTTTNEQDPFTQ